MEMTDFQSEVTAAALLPACKLPGTTSRFVNGIASSATSIVSAAQVKLDQCPYPS